MGDSLVVNVFLSHVRFLAFAEITLSIVQPAADDREFILPNLLTQIVGLAKRIIRSSQ